VRALCITVVQWILLTFEVLPWEWDCNSIVTVPHSVSLRNFSTSFGDAMFLAGHTFMDGIQCYSTNIC